MVKYGYTLNSFMTILCDRGESTNRYRTPLYLEVNVICPQPATMPVPMPQVSRASKQLRDWSLVMGRGGGGGGGATKWENRGSETLCVPLPYLEQSWKLRFKTMHLSGA